MIWVRDHEKFEIARYAISSCCVLRLKQKYDLVNIRWIVPLCSQFHGHFSNTWKRVSNSFSSLSHTRNFFLPVLSLASMIWVCVKHQCTVNEPYKNTPESTEHKHFPLPPPSSTSLYPRVYKLLTDLSVNTPGIFLTSFFITSVIIEFLSKTLISFWGFLSSTLLPLCFPIMYFILLCQSSFQLSVESGFHVCFGFAIPR